MNKVYFFVWRYVAFQISNFKLHKTTRPSFSHYIQTLQTITYIKMKKKTIYNLLKYVNKGGDNPWNDTQCCLGGGLRRTLVCLRYETAYQTVKNVLQYHK